MAITTRLIGKLGGGADIEEKTFSVTDFTGTQELTAVTVPVGETWLIAAIVDVGQSNTTYRATLTLSGNPPTDAIRNTSVGVASMSGPGTVTLTVQTSGNTSNRAITLSGTLYAVLID